MSKKLCGQTIELGDREFVTLEYVCTERNGHAGAHSCKPAKGVLLNWAKGVTDGTQKEAA